MSNILKYLNKNTKSQNPMKQDTVTSPWTQASFQHFQLLVVNCC